MPVPRFRVVCEGPTDFTVIKAVLSALLGQRFVVTLIQPEIPKFSGPAPDEDLGTGWQGVRNWCQQRANALRGLGGDVNAAPGRVPSVLIVHVDADIANKKGIGCEKPCPPPGPTADALRSVVLEWGGAQDVPAGVVLCVPSKKTEAWVFAALHPGDRLATRALECRKRPEALLINRPDRLVRRKRVQQAGRAKRTYDKDTDAYEAVASRIAAAWPDVCRICTQAQRFDDELREALG